MASHDHSYKLLFSHPEMVRDLLEGFVREDWLAQLDYQSLEKVSGTYITDDLRSRADDLVWRVRWGENWIYLYLLIEFQSAIEPYMAVRILTYVGLLYQDLIKARQLPEDGRLPPVLPIVLYNGSVRWSAADELSVLIQRGPSAMKAYVPQMRYLLIDEARYRDSELAPLRNLVAALFRLENSRTPAEIDCVLGTLKKWLSSPEQLSLRRAFAVWLGRVILARLPGKPVTDIDDLQEMRAMLADRIQEWGEEFKREGLAKGHQQGLLKGLEEGLEKGLQEGEARLLIRQLQKRFGALPESVHVRVSQAPPERLELWGERLLDVASLDALFDGEGCPAVGSP
jgi:predicted transposase YdaD